MAHKLVKVSSKKKAAKRTTGTIENFNKQVSSETFSTDTQALKQTIGAASVVLVVNGSDKGVKPVGDHTLSQFVMAQATIYGIRNFSVYLDGNKATTKQSGMSLRGVAKVEIVAKDARGIC